MRGRGQNSTNRAFVVLRQVDRESTIHRLWAGTKLIGALAISITLTMSATWPAAGMAAVLLLVAFALGRIPLSAIPRPPAAFWALVLVGGLFTAISGGAPNVHLLGVEVGLGSAISFLLFLVIAIELFWIALMVGWTTSLGDVAPALSTLMRPLRLVRAPVDEWASTIALCVRSMPLVVSEIRTLIAARRLRPRGRMDGLGSAVEEVADLAVACLAVSMRRASELAEAISARGGVGPITSGKVSIRAPDAVTLGVVLLACVGAAVLPTI